MSESGEESDDIEQPNHAKQKKHKSQQHKDNIQIISAINRIADELIAAEKQEQNNDDGRKQREITTIILLIFTVIFTGLSDLIFFATMKHNDIAASTQHRDTAAAIEAARSANNISQDSANKQLRSYIGLSNSRDNSKAMPPIAITQPRAGESVQGWITLENFGQTPAYDIMVNVSISVVDVGAPPNWGDDISAFGGRILDPHQTMLGTHSIPAPQQGGY
jgi:hypothetical protein